MNDYVGTPNSSSEAVGIHTLDGFLDFVIAAQDEEIEWTVEELPDGRRHLSGRLLKPVTIELPDTIGEACSDCFQHEQAQVTSRKPSSTTVELSCDPDDYLLF